MKIKTILTALFATTSFCSFAQQTLTDEYGLLIDSSHIISMFSDDSTESAISSALSSIGNTWSINSTEMLRTCEWWEGDEPLGTIGSKINQSSSIDNAEAIQRTCLQWSEYPKYYYGTAHIYLSNDGQLDKPVVVVQPYNVNLEDSGYSEQQFYSDINQGGLATSLRSAGYDVILYRYKQQDRGVEFNADGVKRLLDVINDKPGISSTSLVGLSMGGVVTRFALRELEKTGSLNKVATFVSFDAPHLGSNFPRSILDNTNRLLSKIDTSLCGLKGACRDARRKLEAIISKLNTKTFNELIINTPSGSSDRTALLSKLASLGHVQTIPSLALTNGAQSSTQGAPNSILTSHFKLYRAWYNGGSEYFKVYTTPSVDNVSGGYADFYQVFSDLIAGQEHPITPYVTIGQRHSFVSTLSALAGSENYWTEVAAYPSNNEEHMTLTYAKARKIREWLDTYQY